MNNKKNKKRQRRRRHRIDENENENNNNRKRRNTRRNVGGDMKGEDEKDGLVFLIHRSG